MSSSHRTDRDGGRVIGRASLVGKVGRNLRWGHTHGWANLVEEHDWNPVVRARRAAVRLRWRARNPFPDDAARTTVFVAGAQRSGTNMLVHGLTSAPEVRLHNEGDRRAFEHFALRGDDVLRELATTAREPIVVFKALLDSHRLPHLLDLDGLPRTRGLWTYRDVDGRVRSYLAKFGDINLRVLQAFAEGEDGHWQTAAMADDVRELVLASDPATMSPETAAALFWYARNRLVFDLGLAQRPDVALVGYAQLLSEPEQRMRELCAFLAIDWHPRMVAHIERRPPATRRPLDIDSTVREHCEALMERLDRAHDHRPRPTTTSGVPS